MTSLAYFMKKRLKDVPVNWVSGLEVSRMLEDRLFLALIILLEN